jgi:exopolysaccharide production protein ExoQ
VYRSRPVINKMYLYVIAAISLIALISSLWAIDAEEAIERSYKTFFILFPGCLLFSVMREAPPSFVEKLTKALPFFLLGAFILVFIEFITGGLLQSLVKSKPLEENNMSSYNRGMVFLTFIVFPVLVLLKPYCQTYNYKNVAFSVIGIAIVLGTFALTDSQSSQLALIAGITILALHRFLQPWIWTAISLVLILLLFSAPYLAIWMFHTLPALVGDSDWLQEAYAMHRMEIWDFVSRYALQNPLYGYGMEATKAIQDFDTKMLYFRYPVVLHPHNFALQIWIEFGLAGITAASVLTFILIKKMQTLPARSSGLYLAVFFAILCVASTAYGLWQGWFLGAITFIFALCAALQSLHSKDL